MLKLSELHSGVSEDLKDTLKDEELCHPAASALKNYVLIGASREEMPASLF